MFRHFARSLVIGATLAACNSDSTTAPVDQVPPPPPPPALQVGSWELEYAEGQPLPAYIAHRVVDGVLEQVFVDSARLVVQPEGRFEQRIWMRTLRGGAHSHRDTWVDAGSWRREGDGYAFASVGGGRTLSVRPSGSPQTVLRVTERMVGWPGAGLVVGTYALRPPRPGEPSPITVTRFRATDVGGRPLSAVVVALPNDPHQGAETFTQLDSAWVELRSDGTYVRQAHYSTWMSPNVELSLGYTRVGVHRDYDMGRWTRVGGGLSLASSYFQNRAARGTWSGDRMRLLQDMSPNDVLVDVGYSVVAAAGAGSGS